jgi:iron(III) transport system substrate-binding protein
MIPINARVTVAAAAVCLMSWAFPAYAQSAAELAIARQSAAEVAPGLPPTVVDAACKDGTVMLYSLVFRGELQDLAARFHKRFPCLTVRTFVGSGGVLAQRYMSEYQAGAYVADVWMNSSPVYGDDLAQKGLLLNWTPPNAARVPALWKREGAWYAVGLAHIGVAWNTDGLTAEQTKFLDGLTRWDQLPMAPFKGSAGMVDIRAGGTTQLPYYTFEKEYGADFMAKLAALKPTVFNAINPLAERLANGEFDFGLAVTADTAIATQWLKGAPLRWKFLEPGLAVPYFVGVAAKAPHPDAAKLFIAWSLSREGQGIWVSNTGLAPVDKDIPDERKFAHEPWYKLPTTYYAADWNAISKSLPTDTNRFITLLGH